MSDPYIENMTPGNDFLRRLKTIKLKTFAYNFNSLPHSKKFILLVILATGMTIGKYLVQGKIGLTLYDDSFLWYGAQRVLIGEIPIRDFMAYDPGRYYWCAAFMAIFGDNGIWPLRFATFSFEGLGVFFTLLTVSRSRQRIDFVALFLVASTMLFWMYLPFKSFDYTASLALIAFFAYLIEHPSRSRYFIVGLTIGLAAFIGRNHGIYGFAAGFVLIIYLHFTHSGRLISSLAWWTLGIFTGYLPMLVMMLLIPDFYHATWHSILSLIQYGATNLTLPVPWPWRSVAWLTPIQSTIGNFTVSLLIGCFFLALPMFGVFGMIWVTYNAARKQSPPPAVVASIFLVIPYTHYAFSRADFAHLSLGIAPFIIGLSTILPTASRKTHLSSVSLLFCLTLCATFSFQPRIQAISNNWPRIEIGHTTTRVDPWTAHTIALLHKLVDKYDVSDRSFLAMPVLPGAYAAFEKKSPMWQIYIGLYPNDETAQQNELKRIQKADPRLILICNVAIDNRNDLLFQNSHKLIYNYIRRHYKLVNEPSEPHFEIFISER